MRLRALALFLFVAACKPSDPKDPSTWLKRLADSDPRGRSQAVQELRKLKAREAAPQVAQLLKDPLVREEAATALRNIGGPDEVPALQRQQGLVGRGLLLPGGSEDHRSNRGHPLLAQEHVLGPAQADAFGSSLARVP